MPKTTDYAEKLRPYVHHGVDIPNDPKQATGECPFCGKPNHFSVNTETGQFRCLVCEETGNIYSFLQLLHSRSLDTTTDDALESLAEQRSVDSAALRSLGVARSTITGEWLIPMYNNKGSLVNLLRVATTKVADTIKFTLLATPGCKLWPFGLDVFLKSPKPTVYIAEGFWDLVALYGTFSQNRYHNGKLIKSSDPNRVVLATTSVIGVPGAGNFNVDWFEFLSGRSIRLCYDNDHPLLDQETQKPKIRKGNFIRPGWDGMQRVVDLANQQTKFRVKSLEQLLWNPGEPGHNPDLPSGYDLRDAIRDGQLEQVLGQFAAVVLTPISSPKNNGAAEAPTVTPIERTSFQELCRDFRETLHFTKYMQDTLAIMLAVITSTKMPGDSQLWFRVIGPPGSGKTTLAECISAAREWVAPKSILTGFHSGYIDYGADGEAQKDANLLNRLNGKTVVMKDADTLLSSPSAGRIMSELRDIFDRTSRSEYRNKVADEFENLSMTFILCGTNSLRTMDRSYLGERFLDIEILKAGEDRKPFLERASKNMYDTMADFMRTYGKETKQETDEPITPSKSLFLKQVTYGFIKHFEENFHKLQPPAIPHSVQLQIEAMAEFVAHMRARVERIGRADDVAYRHVIELPTRLVQQLTRLPFCLALVLGKTEIDDEVLTITRKVMVDTSCGFQFEIAEQLAKLSPYDGLAVATLARTLSLSDSTVRRVVDDMLELDMLGAVKVRNNSGQRGRNSHLLQLSDKMRGIWNLAMGVKDTTPPKLSKPKARKPIRT